MKAWPDAYDLSLEKAEAKLKLAAIVSALADAKMEIAQIQDDLLEKDRRIKELEEALNIKEEMIWRAPFYYHRKEEGVEDGPFCQQCYDNNNKPIRLVIITTRKNVKARYCTTCKSSFSFDPYPQNIV